MRRLAILTCALVTVGPFACGSRSAIDGGDLGDVVAGGNTGGAAGNTGGAGAAGNTGGVGAAAGRGGTGGGAGFGGFVVPPIVGRDGGFVVPGFDAGVGQACVNCVLASCPGVAACATNTACASGLVCTVTQCGADAGLGNIMCVSRCFGGNLQLALGAATGITCVMQGCGTKCGLGP
jgi:hypothetical protein